MLAQLDMDEKHWAAGRDKLREASRGFAAAELRTGEADAQALLALCAQALGDTAERDAAVDRARTLRQAMTSRQEVYVVDIALAQIGAPTDAATVQKLLALAADAERRQFVAWAWKRGSQPGGYCKRKAWVRRTLCVREIEKTARHHGFGRILKLLQQPFA